MNPVVSDTESLQAPNGFVIVMRRQIYCSLQSEAMFITPTAARTPEHQAYSHRDGAFATILLLVSFINICHWVYFCIIIEV